MSAQFDALEPADLVSRAFDQILREITAGRLMPGERLVEGDIAEQLGTSRGPVREAARLLEQRGLVVSLPRRGFFVCRFELKEIEDLYELREWIEVAAMEAAVKRAADVDLLALRKTHADLVTISQRDNEDVLIDAIVDFHRSLCALSGNGRLMRLFEDIAIEVRQILSVLGVAILDANGPVEGQAHLLEALEARDSDAAAREIRKIVRKARAEVIESYHRKYPTSNGWHPIRAGTSGRSGSQHQ
jgi:DNA-binding GntR family transcriptional regulator